jgi:hypothetical protein
MLPAAPFFNPRQRHPQFAGTKRRVATSHVECAGKPHGTRETSKHALRDVKRGVLVFACRGPLHTGNQQRVARNDDVHSVWLDADEIDNHFDACRGFHNIKRNTAVRRVRASVDSRELFEQTPQLIVGFAPFNEDASHESILSLSLCFSLLALRFSSRFSLLASRFSLLGFRSGFAFPQPGCSFNRSE